MLWVPFASVLVDTLARLSLLLTRSTLPSLTAPSLKVMDPYICPPVAPLTVAVNVTDVPKVDGLSDETSVVVDAVLDTVCLSAPLLPETSPLPLKIAVRVSVPPSRPVAANVAVFVFALTDCVPRVAVPSMNVTVPVTEPPKAGAIFALNVTVCPNWDGLGELVRPVLDDAMLIVCAFAADVLCKSVALPEYTALIE